MLIDGTNVIGCNSNWGLRKLVQLGLGGGSARRVEQRTALVRVQQQLDTLNLLLG